MATNDYWLDQVQEDIIESDLPICDTQQHLWDHRIYRVDERYLMDEI